MPAKGKTNNPNGRPKGIPNKASIVVKEDVLEVYRRLGGVDGLERWARLSQRNLAAFYGWMMTKMLPAAQDITIGAPTDGKPALRIEVVHVNGKGDNGNGNGNGDAAK